MSKWVRAHTNIALIKYWGKKDEELRLPTNSSLSMTLDKFYTDTKVSYDDNLNYDEFYLDGRKVDDKEALRVFKFMNYIRQNYGIKDYARIESKNNVPTAAGLASSASAFAALAKAATLSLELSDEELSKLARMGSGSASRSIYGGFVKWEMGNDHDTSFAKPIEMKPWKDMVMIACIINDKKKPFSSSEAMYETSQYSPYFNAWVNQSHIDIELMEKHLKEHDIEKVGLLAQENALRMHASLLAINKWYFEPETIEIMNIVRELQKEIPVYFTMDAGPNVKLITTRKYEKEVLSALEKFNTISSGVGEGIKVL